MKLLWPANTPTCQAGICSKSYCRFAAAVKTLVDMASTWRTFISRKVLITKMKPAKNSSCLKLLQYLKDIAQRLPALEDFSKARD